MACEFTASLAAIDADTSTLTVTAIDCGELRPGQVVTGLALPHPSHRTGHADLSGSAAIAGFCPHRTQRAALPQWALQEGP
jgi:hypothetical protein